MSNVIPDHIRDFVVDAQIGVVATTRPDGSCRQSAVYHVLDGDRILISTESKRAKARDVERTGRASYCVVGHLKPFPCVTLEGAARVLRASIGAATGAIFAKVSGAPPDAPLTDETLAQMDRVILEIAVEHVYGTQHLEA